ncbi:biotin-dependent carboxyltransferase family protein [Alteromonas sp. H39]|uniref:5-oxoprolinase subunit C family protein n=1 Tax=Alteromonas sp. H39 TaxID=3389876 RepID=UPI0039E0492B
MDGNGLLIREPGLMCAIVDAGRGIHQQRGFSESGPMDDDAYFWGNWLCGNPEGTPAIEWVGPAEFVATSDLHAAVTGPGAKVSVNGQTHGLWVTLTLKEGDRLRVEPDKIGTRHYLGISGNWDVPHIAHSACTVAREKLGGIHEDGSYCSAEDHIRVSTHTPVAAAREVPLWVRPDYSCDTPISVVSGYQSAWFSNVAKQLFFTSCYKITNKIDRMGYRLSGTPVKCARSEMHSEGITLGAVQCPPDGQPIIMMRDRQTLGGYPKLGCVSPTDLNRIAQSVPGEQLAFQPQDADNARASYLLRQSRRRAITGN